MRLKHIQYHHFKGFKSLGVQLPSGANLVVFIGENGSGKTNLLDGMSLSLQTVLAPFHRFGTPNWREASLLHYPQKQGSLELVLEGQKTVYNFITIIEEPTTSSYQTADEYPVSTNKKVSIQEQIALNKAEGTKAYENKEFEKALEYWTKVLADQKEILGENTIDLAVTYHNIGIFYAELGDFPISLEHFQKALSIRLAVLGDSSVKVADSYSEIAKIYNELEDYNTALDYGKKALSIRLALSEKNTKELVQIFHNIGAYSYRLKKYASSLEYAQKALAIRLALAEENNIEGANNFYNVGILYTKLDRHTSALEYHQKALAIRIKLFGETSVEVIESYEAIALAYYHLHKFKEEADCVNKIQSIEDKLFAGEIDPAATELSMNSYLDKKEGLEQNNSQELLEKQATAHQTLVLHYRASAGDIAPFRKANPIAFNIPVTTDFGLILGWFVDRENEENEKRIAGEADYHHPELQLIRSIVATLFKESFDIELSNLRIKRARTNDDELESVSLMVQKNNQEIPAQSLSEGEKRVFLLSADIARRLITAARRNDTPNPLAGAGIVLIDAIDQYLHPKWQAKILPAFAKLFPNVQFITTVNNPQIATDIWAQNEAENSTSPALNPTFFELSPTAVRVMEKVIEKEAEEVVSTDV